MVTIIIIGIIVFLVFNYNTKSRREDRKEKQEFNKDLKTGIAEIDVQMNKKSVINENELRKMSSDVEFTSQVRFLINNNKLLECINFCDNYLEKNPNNYNALYAKADALSLNSYRNNDINGSKNSIEILNTLYAINNKDKNLLILLGDSLMRLSLLYAEEQKADEIITNTANKASDYYYSAYCLDRTDGVALAEYAYAKSFVGENELAMKFIEEARTLSPNNNRIRTLVEEIKNAAAENY
jgi:hypothetical protein